MYSSHIILDFEMNPVGRGFPQVFRVMRQEIIEIGAVKLNSRLEVVSRFRCLVKPDYNPHITPYITKLTGIRFADVAEAPSLGEALELLSGWIGCGQGCRVYSWSGSDLKQLRNECDFKGIAFPSNMKRWLDFQRPFPRMMHMARRRRQLALKDAVSSLDEREKKILSMRFLSGRTQIEVAEEIGISQAQVSRLEKAVLNKIKKEL